MASRPVILCIGGLDPTGGAGLQADIETVASCGGHAAVLCTALTAQNSKHVQKVEPVETSLFEMQFDALRDDMEISACKIGLVPDSAIAQSIIKCLHALAPIPVVLDPLQCAGNGDTLVSDTAEKLLDQLSMECATVLTPNIKEWHHWTANHGEQQTLARLFDGTLQAVLVTGADTSRGRVRNSLHLKNQAPQVFEWKHLPAVYHGSGCTLASALCTFIARGLTIPQAVQEAQTYTWRTLFSGEGLCKHQHIPRRVTNPVTSIIPQKYSQ